MSDPKSNIPKFARDWPINQKPSESASQNRSGAQPNLNRSYNDAQPHDNRIGRLDSMKVRTYAEGEGLIGEPRAVVRSYKVDARGNVYMNEDAYTLQQMRDLQTNLRKELENPNNRNPHTAQNLHNMKELAYGLNAAIETGIDLGPCITDDDLIKNRLVSKPITAQSQASESAPSASRAEISAAKPEAASIGRADPVNPTAAEAAKAAVEAVGEARAARASTFRIPSLEM